MPLKSKQIMTKTLRLFLLLGLLVLPSFSALLAQGVGIPLGSDAYHILDRLEIKTSLTHDYFSSLKYFNRKDAIHYALHIDSSFFNLSDRDKEDLKYLYRDNNEWLIQSEHPTTITGMNEPLYEKVYTDSTSTFYTLKEVNRGSESNVYYEVSERPIFNTFYKTPANLYEINKPGFYLKFNPILNLKVDVSQDDEDGLLLFNQRGLELRGGIDDRIFFYANVLETQAKFPRYINREIDQALSVPGAGFYKDYDSDIFNVANGYDYLNGQGYIGFNATRHVGVQVGHGRHFIGNGIRSMLLSDFSNNYYYLKLNTRIWKFHYQNLFMELAPNSAADVVGDELLDKKYMAGHYLGVKLGKKLNVGIYETVVFSRQNHFEFQYLNPVIFYRTIEQQLGSPDNVLVGLDVKWNPIQNISLYGQFMLDEFKFNELFIERNGWWANKYGVQVGTKFIDLFGVDHLDVQVEYNFARPYTYTHGDSSASYSHYNQELAHPLGANFSELIAKVRYQPMHKLVLSLRTSFAEVGQDEQLQNWGQNILLPNRSRVRDYDNEIGQGVPGSLQVITFDASYQLFHNFYIEAEIFARNFDSDDNLRDLETLYFGGGIRYNIGKRSFDF